MLQKIDAKQIKLINQLSRNRYYKKQIHNSRMFYVFQLMIIFFYWGEAV